MSDINALPSIRVHRNLHKRAAWLKAVKGGATHEQASASIGGQWVRTAGGRVAEYMDSVVLTGVTTRIQPAAQRKCQESGTRSVCAYFDGTRVDVDPQAPIRDWLRVSYDPRVDDCFRATVQGRPGTPVTYPWNTADAVVLRVDGSTWVLNPTWEV